MVDEITSNIKYFCPPVYRQTIWWPLTAYHCGSAIYLYFCPWRITHQIIMCLPNLHLNFVCATHFNPAPPPGIIIDYSLSCTCISVSNVFMAAATRCGSSVEMWDVFHRRGRCRHIRPNLINFLFLISFPCSFLIVEKYKIKIKAKLAKY